MSNKKRLWFIFGPIIVAALLVFILLASPIHMQQKTSQKTLAKAAVSLSPNIMKGQAVKQDAVDDGYVPFFGSSELSRFDLAHPSVLATKYNRSYRPFLLGAAGTTSLTQYFSMQTMKSQLQNKKVVFIVSPQWFTKQGQRKDAFGYYFSPLQTMDWLLHAKDTTADRYAAKRLLDMPSSESSSVMKAMIKQVADGKKLSSFQQTYIKFRYNILLSEDNLFSRFSLGNNLGKVHRAEKQLPAKYSYSEIFKIAGQVGAKETSDNDLGIKNSFFKQRLGGNSLRDTKNSQVHFDYRRSPEYGDFQLILDQFARWHVNVQFIIPPVNAEWQKHTGLSQSMLDETNAKVKYQLRSQGFNNILDMSHDGSEPYFMEDTIHIGWRGWLKADQTINPFLTNHQPRPRYKIDQGYFSKQWQNEIY